MLTDKIWVEKGFQTSINISFDLHNETKIKNFIPTTSAIDIIEDVILSTTNENRARILIGAYGRGKSHIVLMIMALLQNKNKSLFKSLLIKIKIYKPDLYDFLINYINSKEKLLPIIITGSSKTLSQSFLLALKQSLKNAELLDLLPDTNFSSCILTIKTWETEYPDTFNQFKELIDCSIDDFIIKLSEYDISTYNNFIKIYPSLTSGSEFNPFSNVDVVDLYEQVSKKIKKYGFSGIFVIYDEFSKYLETNIKTATVNDTKLLQDFAEKCNRSGSNQMHLMLISHKDISNYVDTKLPKSKVDGWRGVSGRFEHMVLQDNFSQMNEVISQVIKKDTSFWKTFSKENKDNFKNLYHISNLFEKNTENQKIIVEDCYPLHPISTFLLPRLSEKVAQNERTLFTFLSSESKYTLNHFIKNSQDLFPLLTPDKIYDYFEQELTKEPYVSPIFKIYKTTSKALNLVDKNSLSAKIIKTLAVIYIVEQFEKLAPTKDTIFEIFKNYDKNEVASSLDYLIENQCVVYLKRSNDYLKIKESSNINILDKIKDYKCKYSNEFILNNVSFDNYIYPTRYNDEMAITRYFDFTFISNENLNFDDLDFTADGIIYAIITNENVDDIRSKIMSCSDKRVLCILPSEYQDIEKILVEYKAILNLKEQFSDDIAVLDELDIYLDDTEEVIYNFIQGYLRPELKSSEFYWCGQKQNFKRKSHISNKLSEICYELYPNTPFINNEIINKNNVNSVAINSRNKLVDMILNNNFNVDLNASSQEISFLRSTLVMTDILKDGVLQTENTKIDNVLNEISTFVHSSTDGEYFSKLYNKLTNFEFGYGLKKGVLPIYLAVILQKNDVIIHQKENEVPLCSDTLNSINQRPYDFKLFIQSNVEEKRAFCKDLIDVFCDYVTPSNNIFSNIVDSIYRWYMNLPKYSKNLKFFYKGSCNKSEKVDNTSIVFMKSIVSYSNNANDFLFNVLPKTFGHTEINDNLIKDITFAKNSFDNAKNGLIKHLKNDIILIFSKESASLISAVKDYTEKLNEHALSNLFPNGEHKVIELMLNITNDEDIFVERLAKTVTSLRIDDWNYDFILEFNTKLTEIKKSIDTFNNISHTQNEEISKYKVSFIDSAGEEVIKSFEKVDYSDRAKLLYNCITNEISDMGQSITEQETRQILMEILEKMC